MQISEITPMIIVAAACFGFYGAFLVMVVTGLTKGAQSSGFQLADRTISVVIAARNEEKNIGDLLCDLRNQHYRNFEVIVVNDHSHDNTRKLIEGFAEVQIIENPGIGKKRAITAGVDAAKGDIIVTTDADCRVHETWLSSINASFSPNIDMAIGAVVIDPAETLFGRMQQLEFAALIGTSAATLRFGSATMCNGANLAYRKNIFLKVGGYADNLHIPSGDDEFLMRKVLAENPFGIAYIKGVPVKTKPQRTLDDFIQQRLRWAGKWRFNSSVNTKALAVFILVIQMLSLYGFYRLLAGDYFFIVLMSVKLVADWVTVYRCTRFLAVRFNLWPFMLLQLCYPFYVTFVGLVSRIESYTWKERKYD